MKSFHSSDHLQVPSMLFFKVWVYIRAYRMLLSPLTQFLSKLNCSLRFISKSLDLNSIPNENPNTLPELTLHVSISLNRTL